MIPPDSDIIPESIVSLYRTHLISDSKCLSLGSFDLLLTRLRFNPITSQVLCFEYI